MKQRQKGKDFKKMVLLKRAVFERRGWRSAWGVATTLRAHLGLSVLLRGHDCLSGCRLCEVGSQAFGLAATGPVANLVFSICFKKTHVRLQAIGRYGWIVYR